MVIVGTRQGEARHAMGDTQLAREQSCPQLWELSGRRRRLPCRRWSPRLCVRSRCRAAAFCCARGFISLANRLAQVKVRPPPAVGQSALWRRVRRTSRHLTSGSAIVRPSPHHKRRQPPQQHARVLCCWGVDDRQPCHPRRWARRRIAARRRHAASCTSAHHRPRPSAALLLISFGGQHGACERARADTPARRLRDSIALLEE